MITKTICHVFRSPHFTSQLKDGRLVKRVYYTCYFVVCPNAGINSNLEHPPGISPTGGHLIVVKIRRWGIWHNTSEGGGIWAILIITRGGSEQILCSTGCDFHTIIARATPAWNFFISIDHESRCISRYIKNLKLFNKTLHVCFFVLNMCPRVV